MFDKFGEMNSYTEINELAANLLQEGDLDSLKELAKENGIPDDYVEMYLEEAIPSLCDSTSAAIGKIDVECMKLKPKELIGKPWGGMAALRKIEAARAVESFNRRIRNRNYLIREARRYTR